MITCSKGILKTCSYFEDGLYFCFSSSHTYPASIDNNTFINDTFIYNKSKNINLSISKCIIS